MNKKCCSYKAESTGLTFCSSWILWLCAAKIWNIEVWFPSGKQDFKWRKLPQLKKRWLFFELWRSDVNFHGTSQVRPNKFIIRLFQASFPKSDFSNISLRLNTVPFNKQINQLFTALATQYWTVEIPAYSSLVNIFSALKCFRFLHLLIVHVKSQNVSLISSFPEHRTQNAMHIPTHF